MVKDFGSQVPVHFIFFEFDVGLSESCALRALWMSHPHFLTNLTIQSESSLQYPSSKPLAVQPMVELPVTSKMITRILEIVIVLIVAFGKIIFYP